MPKTISIIIPSFNEQENIKKTLVHIKDVVPNSETIIVDSSTDEESKRIIDEMTQLAAQESKLNILRSPEPGRALQMNYGASRAKGDIYLFLHTDTRVNQNSIDCIQKSISDGKKWGRFDVILDASGFLYKLIGFMIKVRSRLTNIATGDQAIFVEKSLFQKINGFPEIPLMEDIALSKTLSKLSKPSIISDPIYTSARRWQNNGVWTTIFLMWKLRFLFWIGTPPKKLKAMYTDER